MDTAYISSIKSKKIIYAVLNWGLGHAARSIPVIDILKKHNDVILASDGEAGDLLKHTFPTLEYEELPSYNIHYGHTNMHLSMLLQLPRIFSAYRKEKSYIKTLINQYKPDIIISDHRYGCRAAKVNSIFLAHQLKIIGSPSASYVNKLLIKKFDECWIPDYEDQRLSGELSNTKGLGKHKFIGPLSRLTKEEKPKVYDLVCVLSGPEPKRSELESKLIDQMKDLDKTMCVVRGTRLAEALPSYPFEVIDLAYNKQLNDILLQSKMVVCRSGYSSIMDLEHIGVPRLLIPTPGQKEQEYLAKHHSQREDVICQEESELDLKEAMSALI